MKIVKCNKCNKYIFKANKCFRCGNNMGFEDIISPCICENVINEYSKLEFFLNNKNFDKAISVSHTVIEWMPRFASVFWMRLLAKNRCVCVEELIERGFNCEEDADFINAIKFSTGIEHDIYLDIKKIMILMRKELEREILIHEYDCKMKTNIMQIKNNMQEEIDKKRNKLFLLWAELERIEQDLFILEKDCSLLSKEYIDTLEKSFNVASSLEKEISRLSKCTIEQLYKYQILWKT